MVSKEPIAKRASARKEQSVSLDERSALIACLEWQRDCGHDGWIKDVEHGGATNGWENADAITHELLQSITRRKATEPKLDSNITQSQRGNASEKSNTPTKDARLSSKGNRQVDSTVALMPAEAVSQAERLALSCDDLGELERAVLSSKLCPLHIGARHGVFAEGNPQSGLMIVGEAPGKEEDEQGKPFVGASGQLLMRMLSYIGITTREQYYITNLVYWRPPGNRTPSPDELLVCHPFFKRQISLLRPRLLLLLGNVAVQTILREKRGITRLRGKFLEYNIDPAYKQGSSTQDSNQSSAADNTASQGIRTLATFHPSYLLRTPSKKAAAWHDLLMLRRAL